GHGLEFTMPIDIWVRPAPDPPVFAPPPLPPLPPIPVSDDGLPLKRVRSAVQRALDTTAVRRLRNYKGAQVWGRSTLSRHDLVRWGRAPGIVVVCSKRCQIRSEARLTGRGAKGSR